MRAKNEEKQSAVHGNCANTIDLSIIIGLLAAVCALVMKGNTVLVILGPGQAGTTAQLMHLRLRRAWATVKISIATNGGKIGITTGVVSVDLSLGVLRMAGGEVVVRDGGQRRSAANAVIVGGAVTTAHTIVTVA